MRRFGLIIGTVLCLGIPVLQQARAEDFPLERRKGFAFNPAPKEDCDWHLITEASVLYQLSRTNHSSSSSGTLFSWQVGFMANTTRNQGWGGALQFGVGSDRARFGIGPVYRRWLKNRGFFDLSGGLIMAAEEEDRGIDRNGWFLQAGAGLAGKISLVTRLEWLDLKRLYATDGGPGSGGQTTMWYGGLNVGGTPGAVFCAVSAVTAVVVLISIANGPKGDFIGF